MHFVHILRMMPVSLFVNQYISIWQYSWNETRSLFYVNDLDHPGIFVLMRLYCADVVFEILYLKHPYILKGDTQSRCVCCYCYLTVKQMMFECPHFAINRYQFYKVRKMLDLFGSVSTDHILF